MAELMITFIASPSRFRWRPQQRRPDFEDFIDFDKFVGFSFVDVEFKMKSLFNLSIVLFISYLHFITIQFNSLYKFLHLSLVIELKIDSLEALKDFFGFLGTLSSS